MVAAAQAGPKPEDAAQADVWRLKHLLTTLALSHVDPALLQAMTERDNRPAWQVFFLNWKATGHADTRREREDRCLLLRGTATLPKLGAWCSQRSGYIAILLGYRIQQPAVLSLNRRNIIEPAVLVPATTYLHRLLAWGQLGPMPPDTSEVDHGCAQPKCVAAAHLQWVSHKENIGESKDRRESALNMRRSAAQRAREAAARATDPA